MPLTFIIQPGSMVNSDRNPICHQLAANFSQLLFLSSMALFGSTKPNHRPQALPSIPKSHRRMEANYKTDCCVIFYLSSNIFPPLVNIFICTN